jgi:hypothetical protein
MMSVQSAISSDGGGESGLTHTMINLRFLIASLTLNVAPFLHAESTNTATATSDTPAPKSSRPMSGGRSPGMLVAALDTDKDGVLSAAEIAHASTVLKALDANEDGVLTPTELRGGRQINRVERPADAAARPVRTSRISSGFSIAFMLDANHDGAIQTMEIANAASSLKILDTNHDGELTPNELELSAVLRPTTA